MDACEAHAVHRVRVPEAQEITVNFLSYKDPHSLQSACLILFGSVLGENTGLQTSFAMGSK